MHQKHLNFHVRSVHEEKKEKNEEEIKSSFENKGLWRKDSNERYQCSTCNKIFKFRCLLQTHIEIVHEKKKPFHCDKCDYRSSTKVHLKDHINQIHDKNFKFKCDQCDKGFSKTNQLQTHILAVHEGKKPYTCEICGKSYTQTSGLYLHTRKAHEGKKEYYKHCEFCPYETSSKIDFDYHVALKVRFMREKNLSKKGTKKETGLIIEKQTSFHA
jgi:uncharacterized Zn-finger protein